jgi:predicted site-specific integrase-resolvase
VAAQRQRLTRKWLTLDEVLDMMPVSRTVFYEWQQAGLIHVYKVPGSRRSFYRIEDVEALPRGHRCARVRAS